jgi:prepilin-type N-terminal cleavage/methylation domain-containing protein
MNHRRQAGYTMVELMMALALLTVGILGIVSLQRVTVVSNGHAKRLAIAQRIAQTWATQLQMDSSVWRSAGNLPPLLSAPNGQWSRPVAVAGRIGGAFNALGAPLPDADAAQAAFCTHVRLSWLYQSTTVSGNDLIRAEIRVFWRRDGHGSGIDGIGNDWLRTEGLCSQAQNPARVTAIGQDTGTFHFLYQTVGIRQHSQI